jgi:hypothetical protein
MPPSRSTSTQLLSRTRPLSRSVGRFGLGLLLAAGLGACSSLTGSTTPSSEPARTGSFTERMSSTLFGEPAKPVATNAREPEKPECPPVDVREGASTITTYAAGESVATNVRYQATVGQLARECALMGATMTIKVGMQARVLLGPAGGPGRLDVPIRFALVHEGPEPKTIWTKLYKVPVNIPAGQTNVAFTHVEDNMTFPKPSGSDLERYVIYAGFDRAAAGPAAKSGSRRPRRSPR